MLSTCFNLSLMLLVPMYLSTYWLPADLHSRRPSGEPVLPRQTVNRRLHPRAMCSRRSVNFMTSRAILKDQAAVMTRLHMYE
jgi:hypothetical protein